jgi:protein-arginine deiminase
VTAPGGEIWIRADTNRDGRIDEADEPGKTEWTPSRGAIFLANIDDDGRRFAARAPDGRHLTDAELALCNDAADEVVNGDEDVDDLAKLLVNVPVDARRAAVTVDERARDRVRLFAAAGDGTSASDWSVLPADGALAVGRREPLLLGIEARDIVRDASWDGRCRVSLAVECADGRRVTDVVVLKVAPLLFVHDLLALETLYGVDNVTSVFPGEPGFPVDGQDARIRVIEERIERTQAPFHRDVVAGLAKVGLGADAMKLLPNLDFRPGDPELDAQIQWAADFTGGSLGQTGVDIWPQDIMRPAFMAMPAPGGQHVMWVWVRCSARNPKSDRDANPLRYTSRVVFTELLGPGCAAVQHFDPAYLPRDNRGNAGPYSSFDMGGNYAVVPPHTHDGRYYPHGRKLAGAAPGYTADPAFNAMLDVQGHQRPIYVDTGWLEVGHVDEFVAFVESDTPRGWTMVLADPELALDLLRAEIERGNGGAPLFSRLEVAPGIRDARVTIADALQSDGVREGSAKAVAGIDRALATLRDKVGLTDADVVRLPVLFRVSLKDLDDHPVEPLLPNAVNLVNTGRGLVMVARQHGPVGPDGDVFEAVVEERLRPLGIAVHWVEDLGYAHPAGEVHCATNVRRDLRGTDPWWLEG